MRILGSLLAVVLSIQLYDLSRVGSRHFYGILLLVAMTLLQFILRFTMVNGPIDKFFNDAIITTCVYLLVFALFSLVLAFKEVHKRITP